MTTAIIQELARNPELLYRHTVEDYHQMIAGGMIEEGAPFELLDGQVVRKIRSAAGEDPMTVGTEHALIVKILASLSRQIEPMGCHIQTQQPVTLPSYDEPEPDAAIISGTVEAYAKRHPAAPDILCVIEVADASLKRDRGYKHQIYAGSGIPMYVIVNLVDRAVEVYTQPAPAKTRYAHIAKLTPRQTLTLPACTGKGLAVPVRRLLPAAE